MWSDIISYGENGLLIRFKNEISHENHLKVKYCYETIKNYKPKGLLSIIPAYSSITLIYNPHQTNKNTLSAVIKKVTQHSASKNTSNNSVTIPVCYHPKYGLDIEYVAQKLQCTPQKIIELHTAKPYLVHMLGFAPGFMYLGGLNKQLHIARKETPRLKINAGAVGLADEQTGVYPLATPGGWQIIGQTPLVLFSKNKPSIVQMGDFVKFKAISVDEFEHLKKYNGA